MVGKKWTKEDLEFFELNCHSVSHGEMARILGRTVASINRKKASLGLSVRNTGTRLSEDGFKRCSKCLEFKEADLFSNKPTRLDGKDSWCLACHAEKKRKTKYALSQSDYEQRLKNQNGKCGICKKTSKLVVDHCHQGGQVRGLLCLTCNMLLGMAGDNCDLLESAIIYLKQQ